MNPSSMQLSSVDRPIRLLLTSFLVTISLGYAAGLYFVGHTTNVSPAGTVEQFRGNEDVPIEEVEEIKYAKDTLEMMNIIHTHVTSFALIYLVVGGIFLFTGCDPRLKIFLAVEPFAATIVLFGGMAVLRYFGDGSSTWIATVMMAAGMLTTLAFYGMVVLSLRDLWRK